MKESPRIRVVSVWPFASILDVIYCTLPGLFLILIARLLVVVGVVPDGAARAVVIGGTIGIIFAALKMIPVAVQVAGDQSAALSRQLNAERFEQVSAQQDKAVYRSLRPIWPKWDRRWDSDRIIVEKHSENTRIIFPLQRRALIKRIL